EAVRELSQEVVAPVSAKHDKEKSFPYQIVSQMGEMGLFGLPIPEEYGGQGGDYFTLCLALEELGKVDQPVALALEAGVSLGTMPSLKYGTAQQRQHWLPALADAEHLAGFGSPEPGAGSDAAGTQTRARLADGTWTITGNKDFITNAGTDITSML